MKKIIAAVTLVSAIVLSGSVMAAQVGFTQPTMNKSCFPYKTC